MTAWLDMLTARALARDADPDDGALLARPDWPRDFADYLAATRGLSFDEQNAPRIELAIPFNDRPSITNEIAVLYGESRSDPPSRGWLTATDVSFPRGVLAVGRFFDSSLLCISLRESDHGTVYYWDYYWNYPWRRGHFTERVDAACVPFGDFQPIIKDPCHPRHDELMDATNQAVLTKIADSFSAAIIQLLEHHG